jgi:DNA-binding LytR/AlgR family response regulator
MDNAISILIVEDDLLIAQDLNELLEEFGYKEIFKARNYHQAIGILQSHPIDLALLDINLNDIASGITLANDINQHYQIPFIYITSYSDASTIDQVKHTRPAGFLLKPYNKDLLLAKIEIAVFNYINSRNAAEQPMTSLVPENDNHNLVINKHLLIKDNYRFVKLPLANVLWFESDRNYVDIKTIERKYTIRCSLKKLAEELPANDFVKCYKQFIINIRHVDSFTTNAVAIKGQEIPISRTMQDEVLAKLKHQTV